MTPHPLATFAQLTLSPRRHAQQQRRRRRAARMLALRSLPHQQAPEARVPVTTAAQRPQPLR